MNVARCDDGDTELVRQPDYMAVYLVKLLLGGKSALAEHESVVAVRLNLEVIIHRGYPQQLLLGFARKHRAVELTRFAGAADEQALSVRKQLALRHSRMAVIILKI